MHYHIAVKGVQSGPFSLDELRLKLAAGEVGESDLCWREGWSEWRQVAHVFSSVDAPPTLPPQEPIEVTTSRTAVTSLVLGIVSLVFSVAALPAVICGHIALSKIKRARGAVGGAGMALAGLGMGYVRIGVSLVVISVSMLLTLGKDDAHLAVAGSNLRQIGLASLIYASDHTDKLPVAEHGWSYAAALARYSGLNDATFWFAGDDRPGVNGPSTVLAENGRDIAPDFRAARLSYAMPLGGITVNMPATTPIAWTRGLQPDGTWAEDSPHGTRGGHIVFLGGKVIFLRRLESGTLVRFDGGGNTLNIREALPPGVRIFEP